MTGSQPRDLPAHIAAALQGAGGESDTAGQPWAGRELHGQYHQFDADEGAADPALESALKALISGMTDEAAVVQSLSQARVFVPIVAEVAQSEAGPHGLHSDKESEMALVSVQAPDGRRALPVFSDIQRLQAWHPQARPVAVYAPRAALSAVAEEAQLLVLDPGAEFTFVVRRPAVWALAQQKPWLPSYLDGALHARVREIVEQTGDELVAQSPAASRKEATTSAAIPLLRGLDVLPGSGIRARTAGIAAAPVAVAGGGIGPELRLVLLLGAGLQQGELNELVAGLQRRLAEDSLFAELVDSLEISIQGIESEEGAQ
ncbi:SseB family protein [Psychromicrobium sp. YIM B11713]|uniref:SseB family protein n=1 Tax=Psychromicrobium sp. YIM B11713 TaxID=3145233 RepID=UPI00374F4A01